MLPASTAPRHSVRVHGAHFAPDGRQAVTGRVRQTVPHRLADPGSVWRDHLPSVTRLHFVECAGNRHNGRQKTMQETHGMTSCSEWTGVLLSTLLKECGLKGSATWFV